MKYTINQFRKEYPTNDVCLDVIFKLRYDKIPCCPQCQQETTFKRVKGRRCYQCSDKDCKYQLYPTAGTVFESTRTSLVDWFYVIYLMTSTRNGVSAKEIQRQLGVTYKCAWRMGHQIRLLMKQDFSLLSGIVEVDETYIGGDRKNKHKSVREATKIKGYMENPFCMGQKMKLLFGENPKNYEVINFEIYPYTNMMSADGFELDNVEHNYNCEIIITLKED